MGLSERFPRARVMRFCGRFKHKCLWFNSLYNSAALALILYSIRQPYGFIAEVST